jgi:hypothetical protein
MWTLGKSIAALFGRNAFARFAAKELAGTAVLLKAIII